MIRNEPCSPWTDVAAVRACGPFPTDPPTDAEILFAIAAASEILYLRSGHRFSGVCEDTVRPCAQTPDGRGYAYHGVAQAPLPASWSGSSWAAWLPSWGVCLCNRDTSCGCCSIPSVRLGGYPLVEVTEVLIDGAALAPAAYRIDNDRTLVRIDGDGWPCCQDFTADPATDPDTFEVTFRYGREVPPGGQRAAALYAAEIVRACSGAECALPDQIASLTRQGVAANFVDVTGVDYNGRTGIPLVEEWLDAVNPSGRRRPMMIASPDVGRDVRRTKPPTLAP